jgi:glyoxylase-like metal-dependent hydrolase (beta-lactamase superfamily II)
MKKNLTGIEVVVLGDFGPFSRTGKSIGYLVRVGSKSFLVDCGAPLFDLVGGEGIKMVDGFILTHCHDDHKRWFTDLALFYYYTPEIKEKLLLIAPDEVHDELVRSSKPALDRSLSIDSYRMIDIAFEDYVVFKPIGPRAKYSIEGRRKSGKRGELRVVDSDLNELGPDRAKIVLSERGGRARILFRDPDSGEWVEPESYYQYSSKVFYEEDRRAFEYPYRSKVIYEEDASTVGEGGFKIEALKAPVWHGIAGAALRFTSGEDSLLFTSDTVHDVELWERLAGERHEQKFEGMSRKEFEEASIIRGDINDFIERIWSPERLRAAKAAFEGVAVIQDISTGGSVVHTDYERIGHTVLDRDRTILTHSPDFMTAEWPLCYSEKTYRVTDGRFYEVVGKKLYEINADLYHKDGGKFYVGYRNAKGAYHVHEHDGVLSVHHNGAEPLEGSRRLFGVDLYEDIGGEYFPALEGGDAEYRLRSDGLVERVEFDRKGSRGKVVNGIRGKLTKNKEL